MKIEHVFPAESYSKPLNEAPLLQIIFRFTSVAFPMISHERPYKKKKKKHLFLGLDGADDYKRFRYKTLP